ncbi:hypothetical protein GLOIN_2v1629478 [Rhizophagus irregularis DAOM 181602=DAOM 197198]|nr:hypothetical protein GLOIN_2v1629478 [Rhizophagus irregularis DAOM 181602=DAOM 197198]
MRSLPVPPGKCLSTEYVNSTTPMLRRCGKGHEWSTTLYLIKNKGKWSIRRPDFLKIPEHPRGLELDIYYPQYGFAIEVQGKQHEQHIKYFHKGPEEFEKQLMRDQLKKKLCEKNLIVLRYVWYYEDPNIVIPNHLRELGLIE